MAVNIKPGRGVICLRPGCDSYASPCVSQKAGRADRVLWLCSVHAAEQGFCSGCGRFFGRELDRNSVLCRDCVRDIKGNEDDYPDSDFDDYEDNDEDGYEDDEEDNVP